MLRSEIKKQAQRLLHRNYGRWSTLLVIPFIAVAGYIFIMMAATSSTSYDMYDYQYEYDDYYDYDLWDDDDSYDGASGNSYMDGYNDGYDDGYDDGWYDAFDDDSYYEEENQKEEGRNLHALNLPVQGFDEQLTARNHLYDYNYGYRRSGSVLIGLFAFLFGLAIGFVVLLYQAMMKWAAVDNAEGLDFGLKLTFTRFFKENGRRAVPANLLVWLYTFLWSLLFIVPGLVKQMSYSMTNYLMRKDESLSAKEAIALSMELMKGYKMEYFLFTLSFIPWYVLTFFSMGISLFYVTPYFSVSEALFFDQIIAEKHHLFSKELEAGFTDF
ncbi:DUF975 family protein [Enterococcus sp. LJL51]|uniref:DUF975 family protein n=1 Tax=Enterococcus sp. LJL51 TaxID=3416656 RepID=UPI003CF804EA